MELLKFITCGSVDDGKSTLIGHILYDSNLLYADQEQALILESKVGAVSGEIDYSLLLDGLMAEREQKITIDVAYRYFTTDKRSFIVADTPGHEEYTRNMAVGASFADLAVILIDASKGVISQTKRHMRICDLMGIKHFVFAVNKMDLIGYEESKFRLISSDINDLVKEIDVKSSAIIPVSATKGDNITLKSRNIHWYNGKTLLDYLETIEIYDEEEKGFYMPVQRVCRPNHSFRGFQGQIESGSISVGDVITAYPSGESAVVSSIFIGNKQMDKAFYGQPITMQLDREVDVSRGCVISKELDIRGVSEISVSLLWMDDNELIKGNDYWLKIGTRLVPAVIKDIYYKLDINSGKRIKTNTIKKNEIASCEIVLVEKVVADEFTAHRALGEFIIIDRITHSTAACGRVDSISEDKCKDKRLYPDDFDIPVGSQYLFVRNGKVIGYGEHEKDIPIYELGSDKSFTLMCLWNNAEKLEYEI